MLYYKNHECKHWILVGLTLKLAKALLSGGYGRVKMDEKVLKAFGSSIEPC